MDPLSAVIALLRPHAALSKPITGRGTWGVRYSAYGMPGFAIVLQGQCWLAIEEGAPIQLGEGDFILLPATPAFEMSSHVGLPCKAVEPSQEPLRHGDSAGDPDFRMLGGSFQIEPANASVALTLLPRMIHIRSSDTDTTGLARIIGLIMEECAGDRPGAEMVLERLLEVMLIEALRREPVGGDIDQGLLRGLRDPAVAKALRAIHLDVRRRWTVADLAGIACMSRSAFAVRFADTVGCPPIEYLARWRIMLAKDRLCLGGVVLERLAQEIGYESASAFSTAFRRRVSCPPAAFARAYRRDASRPTPMRNRRSSSSVNP